MYVIYDILYSLPTATPQNFNNIHINAVRKLLKTRSIIEHFKSSGTTSFTHRHGSTAPTLYQNLSSNASFVFQHLNNKCSALSQMLITVDSISVKGMVTT